jgi:urea transport system permease protein
MLMDRLFHHATMRQDLRETEAARSLRFAEPDGRRRMLPVIEAVVLVILALAPLALQAYVTVYATRVLILCLFALSFDLVWGYAGIMSFGQSLFFGAAGYGVALIARDLDIASICRCAAAGWLSVAWASPV